MVGAYLVCTVVAGATKSNETAARERELRARPL